MDMFVGARFDAVARGVAAGFFFLCSVMISASQAYAQDLPQRMRLPVGSYWISGGGGGNGGDVPLGHIRLARTNGGNGHSAFSMPAYCVDRGRKAPNAGNTLTAFSGDIRIQRYEKGRLIEEKSLADAVTGATAWVSVTGQGTRLGSVSRISINPVDDKYDYAVQVNGLAPAGTDAPDVNKGFAEWKGNDDVMKLSGAFDLMRTTLGSAPNYYETLEEVEKIRQGLEWSFFGGLSSGANFVGAKVNQRVVRGEIDYLVAADFGSRATNFMAADRGDWITLTKGSGIGETEGKQLSRAMSAIGVEVEFPQDIDRPETLSLLANGNKLIALERTRALQSSLMIPGAS